MLVSLHSKAIVRSLLALFLFGAGIEVALSVLTPATAEARAGRGRSSGRSSGFQRSAPSRSQPENAPSQGYQQQPYQQQPVAQPPNAGRGGLFRSIAGGMAGGFLGSMLFSSLGHAGTHGGMGGGVGMLEILLIAGLAYFAFRWWKNRQVMQTTPQQSTWGMKDRDEAIRVASPMQRSLDTSAWQALNPVGTASIVASKPLDSDAASDLFFRIQGAWTRRDLSSVQDLLTAEMVRTLGEDLAELRAAEQVNRLENISVRSVEVGNPWQEDDGSYMTVRFKANLLDYTVKEGTNQLVAGSNTEPVKFAEDWTFFQTPGTTSWKLAGIEQV